MTKGAIHNEFRIWCLQAGRYAPRRRETYLYTRGSVDFFRTYPGMYVPNPLLLHAQRRDTPDWNLLLKETLALTKMNCTQFDGADFAAAKLRILTSMHEAAT
jgi:hypothetical protein